MTGSADVTAADRRNWREGNLSFDQSRRRIAEASQWLAGGVSSNFRLGISPTPLVFDRADGAYLFDADGNRLIDYYLGMGPMILGHTPQDVIAAATAQMQKGLLYGGQSAPETEAARLFCDMVPCADLMRFCSSGSEAVQCALRLARTATGRRVVIKFEGHYHGWFDNILWSTAPGLTAAGPDDAPTPVAGSKGQAPVEAEGLALLQWNDLAALEARLAKGDIAGVLMEPAMCNQGAISPAPGYLEGALAACRKHGAILIFDEVITGFRLAAGGAQQRFGVTPDLAIFAKAIANGFPVAAITGRADLMDMFATGGVLHGGTFNSQPVTMAAMVATQSALTPEHYERTSTYGTRLQNGVREALSAAGIKAQVTGFPLMFHVAFGLDQPAQRYRDLARSDKAGYTRFAVALLRRGVRVLERGAWFVSSEHDDGVVDQTLETVYAAAREVALALGA